MKKLAPFMVLLAAILWGSNGIFINALSDSGLGSIERTSFRLLIAVILEAFIVWFTDRDAFRIDGKGLLWSFLIGMIGIYLFLISYTACIVRVGMGVAGVLIYLMPALVLIYGAVFRKQKLSLIKIVSIVMNLAGCALVSGIVSGGSFDLLGVLLGVLTAFCYAFNNIALAEKLKGRKALTKMFYPALSAALCALVYLVFSADGSFVFRTALGSVRNASVMVLWALCCSAGPYYLFNRALQDMDVMKASLLSTFEPVAAVLFGVFLFHEQIDLFGVIGVILVLASLIISELKK